VPRIAQHHPGLPAEERYQTTQQLFICLESLAQTVVSRLPRLRYTSVYPARSPTVGVINGVLRHLSVRSVFRGQARHVIEVVTLVDTASIAVYGAQHETDDPASRCGSFNGDLRSAI